MNDDLPHPPYASIARPEQPEFPVAAALPAGALTASVLFDVLSFVAESPHQAQAYNRSAVDLLKAGLGTALATLALGVVDALKIPAGTPAGDTATKHLALDGAVLAIYLLAVAAREKHLAGSSSRHTALDSGSIGLSLAGLVLLAASGKLR